MTDRLVLRYSAPAGDWESQTLPIGNGSLGASIWGDPAVERLTVDVDSLWTGGPGSVEGYGHGDWPEPRPGALDRVRHRIDAEGSLPAGEVAELLGNPGYFGPLQHIPGYGAYQVLGELRLRMADTAPVTGYRRTLRLDTAIADVSYRTASGVGVRREYFASAPAGVIVVRLTAEAPGGISFAVEYESPHSPTITVDAGPTGGAGGVGDLVARGTVADNGMVNELRLRTVTEGGSTGVDRRGRLAVAGADAATIYLTAGTDYAPSYPTYRGDDPSPRLATLVDAATAAGVDELRAAHVADADRQLGRATLDLGGRVPRGATTDVVRRGYGGGDPTADRWVEEALFAYGRYLLVSSSQPGGLPANMQGVWNDSTSPPWHCDYHTNINAQMNYWPAEVTNLPETVEPLTDFVEALVEPGRVSARSLFGTPGWVVHSCTNIFGFTGVHDWPLSFWMPEAAAWILQPLYEHARFTGDLDYLRRRAYPPMREVAEFWLANLRPDPRDGRLVVNPSFSPEQGPFTAGAAASQQIVAWLLQATLDAADLLDIDRQLRGRIETTLDRLDHGLAIGSWGQILEWRTELAIDTPLNGHRHTSHLFALYPGEAIRAGADEDLERAARVVLEARGDRGPGWSTAWRLLMWARLRDGERAHRVLSGLIENSILDNLWDDHPPFQIDGNLGVTAGIAEMLIQSHDGGIDLLPAVPAVWATGRFAGLVARGGIAVDAAWTGGAIDEVRLRPSHDGPIVLRSERFRGDLVVAGGAGTGGAMADGTVSGGVVAARRTEHGVAWDAAAGGHYVVTSTGADPEPPAPAARPDRVPVPEHRLNRFSPLDEWIEHPRGGDVIGPFLRDSGISRERIEFVSPMPLAELISLFEASVDRHAVAELERRLDAFDAVPE